MSERLLTEDDYRSFDRSIGMDAALSINAIITDTGISYTELQQQSREGVIAPQVGSYLLRAEETTDRHIGRRAENDNLFVGTGLKENLPALLEPYSKNGADALLSEAQHEKRVANIARLQNSISELTEPVYASFLDKVPLPSDKQSRWRRSKEPTPIAWSEQNPLKPTLVHNFNLQPLKEGLGFSEVTCKNTSQESYSNGVSATLTGSNGRATHLKLAWTLHMDYGDAPATLNLLAPGLLDQCEALGIKKWGEGNTVSVDLDEPALTLTAATYYPSFIDGITVAYTYNPDSDCFTSGRPDLPVIPPETYLEITQQILNFVPTIRVQ